jgi:hypothetical protein
LRFASIFNYHEYGCKRKLSKAPGLFYAKEKFHMCALKEKINLRKIGFHETDQLHISHLLLLLLLASHQHFVREEKKRGSTFLKKKRIFNKKRRKRGI